MTISGVARAINRRGRVLIPVFAVALILVTLARVPKAFEGIGATHIADCNDPDATDHGCLDPTKALIDQVHNQGYPYYIGHAEPTTEWFSTTPLSGNNMRWKFKLPANEPTPTQNGSAVSSFELYPTFWMGLALCDPNSFPFGACIADSDANNPNTAGSAFLELQVYPPGINCSASQWCAALHINTFEPNPGQAACLEPTTAAFVTTDGTPGGPKLLMNDGDDIVSTIHDTAGGLETDVTDLTTGKTGFMVASAANGFLHNANTTDCTTAPFTFHPEYATASPGNVVPWTALLVNVGFDFEIGHWELCKNASCLPAPANLPDGGDADDTGCGPVLGVGGCFGADLDHDGTSYLADWPDGSIAHPDTVVIGSPNGLGVGPLSTPVNATPNYKDPYNTIKFANTEATDGAFYPFWSISDPATACVFNFGNDIPGVTTNDFGQAAQYGTTIVNPCLQQINLNPNPVTIGPVCKGSTSQGELDVSNTGFDNLIITNVTKASGSADISLVTGPTFPVNLSPDSSFSFSFSCTPTTFGPKTATFNILSNDPVNPTTPVTVTCTVASGAVVTTGSGDFGAPVCGGTTPAQTIKVNNVGGCNLNLLNAFTTCSDFHLVNPPAFPVPISPDSGIDLTVKFTPTSAGFKSCSLEVNTDDPIHPTVFVPLTGTTQLGSASISVPAGILFPPTVIQQNAACPVQIGVPIVNSGACPVAVTDVEISQTSSPEDYSLTGLPGLPVTLASGGQLGSGDLDLVFEPFTVARESTGTVDVTFVDDPILHTTTTDHIPFCGEAVHRGLRVLVTLGGSAVAGVKEIDLQSAFGPEQPQGNFFTKKTIKHAALQTVTGSTPPCPSFQFHAEFGGESDPFQLKDGTYRIKVKLKVGKKTKTKIVRVVMDSCSFTPNVIVAF